MSLVTVERIKLFSTRSPWWCMIIALILADGFITLGFLFAPTEVKADFTPAATQGTYLFGMIVMMAMACLAITTEYRFGTIRTSFLSVPKRITVLLSKTLVDAVLSGLVGLVSAFVDWGLGYILVPDRTWRSTPAPSGAPFSAYRWSTPWPRCWRLRSAPWFARAPVRWRS